MSDESRSNEHVLSAFLDAVLMYVNANHLGMPNMMTQSERLAETRAAVLARMSSPSHDRATSAEPSVTVNVSNLLNSYEMASGLAAMGDESAYETRDKIRAILDATLSAQQNAPSNDRAMAERGWQPINDQTPTNRSVLIYIPNAEHYGPGIYRAILVDMGTGRRWHTTGFAVGRDLTGDVTPTHWMHTPAPPTPTTKEETA
jgi:hypothetical protein